MEIQDKTLTCSECGLEFVFTEGEQKFYQEKGFTHEPKRCKECRARKKDDGRSGRPRTRDSASGSPVSRGVGGSGRGGRSASESFSAVCSACGGPARLSFRPSPDKPVYCRSCYQTRTGAGGTR